MKSYTINQWGDLSNDAFFDADLQSISFGQWLNLVNQVKQYALSQSSQVWLVSHTNSFYFSIAWLGLLAAGKTTLLPPNNQQQTLSDLGNHYDRQLLEAELDYIIKKTNHPIPEKLTINANAQCLFFTSGSSGKPKSITKAFSQLMLEVQQLNQQWPLNQNQPGNHTSELFLSTVSHQHIYGLLFRLLWPIDAGKPIYIPLIEYPEILEALIQSNKINRYTLISSPAFLQRLQNFDLNNMARQQYKLNYLFSSGGPLSYLTAQNVKRELSFPPIEIFGSTETGGIAYRQQWNATEPWRTFPNINIRCDHNMRLSIQSPYLSNDDQLQTTGNWYRCDDRIEQISEHSFNLRGRADRVVKIEEKRVSLDELELKLQNHKFIVAAKTALLPGKRIQIAALIQLNTEGLQALQNQGKLELNRTLRTYMMKNFESIVLPRKWRYTNQIPYNQQGKLSQQTLLSLFENTLSNQT